MVLLTLSYREPAKDLKHVACYMIRKYRVYAPMGGDLGGTISPNLRWEKAHASDPPNILRSSVIGCERKYEVSFKKGVIKEFFQK